MRGLVAFAGALILLVGTNSAAQELSYDGVWGADYWRCVNRAGDRAMRGPMPVEQAVQSAFDACRRKRPRAVSELRSQGLPSSWNTPETAEAMMQSTEASIRRTMTMHFTEMRRIPGFWRHDAQN
jgi:hypothetical protein